MKVFIVTAGYYEDYCIYGVFSTKGKAQEYIDNSDFGDPADIEEYEMDEGI